MAGEKPFQEQLSDRQFEEKKSEYRRRFDSMFGKLIDPGETASALLRTAIDRMKTDEYLKQVERVRILFSQQWTRIVDLLVEKAKAKAKIHADTQGELKKLEDYLLSFEAYALTFKGRNNPYGEKEDTFDVTELVEFEKWAQSLRGLNPAELIDTLEQNERVENTLLFLMDEKYADKFEDFNYLDFHNPEHVEHLMEFILGKGSKTKEGKEVEKSRFRVQTEYMLWMEIVRRLDFGQKEKLILTFLEKKGAQTTKEFIARCIVGGLITRVELEHMYMDERYKDKFAALGAKNEFEEFIKAAAVEKERVDAQLKDYAKQIETPQLRSFVADLFSFPKLTIETFARCGLITAVLNSALCIVDRWNARKEKESMIGAVLLGTIDAAHDPYVLGGTAAALAGYDYITPGGFLRDWVNSPDAAEIEHLARNRDYKYLREMQQNRHEVTNWFVDHYEDLRFTAKDRLGKKARNPRTGETEVRKGEDIYPEDLIGKDAPEKIRITAQEAKNMGYDSPEQAMIPMIRMFNICTKVFAEEKIDTADKLGDFFDKANVYEKEPTPKST